MPVRSRLLSANHRQFIAFDVEELHNTFYTNGGFSLIKRQHVIIRYNLDSFTILKKTKMSSPFVSSRIRKQIIDMTRNFDVF